MGRRGKWNGVRGAGAGWGMAGVDIALQRRALEALGEALDQPDAERSSWVDATYADEPELATLIHRLLQGEKAGARDMPTLPPERGPAIERPPPERVGPYRLSGLLGRGGMSAVYLGERDDGLFEHTVAVKVMSAGLFAGAMQRHFDLERRILARLRHPNIAQLYDGGVGEGGAPYFIMERLTGEAIDAYVRVHGLGPRETVGLVLQVCAAVSHAHQNLVVHADIKPSNVLVGEDGAAKLLDFGIAQIMEEAGDFAPEAFPVTPAYASPQRLAGELPTPADDVFSLGALLHDLLTGVAPTEQTRAAPSAALQGGDDAARSRARVIRGDLDAIALKAMAKAPADRYPSVEALAEDLRRWEERRPVLARNPDWRMSAWRYVQRHPWAVAASIAAVLGLIAALAVTTSLYVEAQRARQAADQRFSEVRGMAKYMLFDLYDGLDRTPQSLALRRDLAREGQLYLNRLTSDSKAPVTVRVEAIEGLVRLAAVQGAPGHPNLGEAPHARANLERAAAIASDLARANPQRADVWLAKAGVEMERVVFLAQMDGATDQAEAALNVARAAIDSAARIAPGSAPVMIADVKWTLRAAELRQWQSRYRESSALARRALTWLEAHPAADIEGRLRLARAWDLLAESNYFAGPETTAEAPYRKALGVVEALAREHPEDPVVMRELVRARWALGTTLAAIHKADESLAVLRLDVADAERMVARDSADENAKRMLRLAKTGYAQALGLARRFPEAIAAMREQVADRREILRRNPDSVEALRDLSVAIGMLGETEGDAGRSADACATYDEEIALLGELRRRGRLTGLDQEHALRTVMERRGALCSPATSPSR